MENEAAQQPQSPAASPVMSRRAREANPFRAMVFGEQADSENTSISVTNEQNFSFYFEYSNR